ncbi:hypothetical protein V5O48_014492 [Marasmius crinis-equi]|uniref:Uncharacterized protein n=1 Tax=Marasmius crinis-equi TaxID=585013 RepID=A0ABR3EX71_9AGAR
MNHPSEIHDRSSEPTIRNHEVHEGSPVRNKPEFLGPYSCLLEYTLDRGLINLSESEIKGNVNHGDIFAKLSAILSTGWFWVQIAARGAQGLLITELEVVTLSFTVLSFAAYFLWLDKPQRVRFPIRVSWELTSPREAKRHSTCDRRTGIISKLCSDLRRRISADHDDFFPNGLPIQTRQTIKFWSLIMPGFYPTIFFIRHTYILLSGNDNIDFGYGVRHINLFRTGSSNGMELSVGSWMFLAFVIVIVGSLHFIAWASQFPNLSLRGIWRTSTILLLIIPLLVALRTAGKIYLSQQHYFKGFLELRTQPGQTRWNTWKVIFRKGPRYLMHRVVIFVLDLIAAAGFTCYSVARFNLIVVAIIIPLRYGLPDAGYQDVNWLEYIPHIG